MFDWQHLSPVVARVVRSAAAKKKIEHQIEATAGRKRLRMRARSFAYDARSARRITFWARVKEAREMDRRCFGKLKIASNKKKRM